MPKAPKDLSPVAKDAWKRIVHDLDDIGGLDRVDSHVIEIYAKTYALFMRATTELETVDLVPEASAAGKLSPHPLVGIVNTTNSRLVMMLAEMGLTPKRRSKRPDSTGDKWSSLNV